MPHLLILGFGNPLRGDDGLGWHAVERLRDHIADPEIEIKAVHQLTPEISELLSRSGRVIFIDAAAEGEPGQLQRRTLTPDPGAAAFTHQATPSALLAAAQKLFGHAPEAELFSIPIESADFGYRLTPTVEQALDNLVVEILALAQV
jgi:hydrogenase maturation protease